MKKFLSKNVVFLGFISLLNDIASDMIYPLLPIFITSVGGNAKVLGFIEGFSESISSILKLISGKFSDKIKKRKLLAFWGYFLSNALRPLYVLANHWLIVFFVRFFDRVGKGIRTAPRDALIADSVSAEFRGRAFGFHRTLDNFGALLGPLIATLILYFTSQNIKAVFLFSLIPGIFVLVLFFFIQEKEQITHSSKDSSKEISFEQKERLPIKVKFFLISILIFTLGNSSDAFIILRLKDTGIDTVYIPIIWGIFNLIKSLGNYPLGLLSDKIGRKKVILMGWILYAIIYFLFGLVDKSHVVLILFFLYGVYYSLTEGAERAFIADNVMPYVRGKAYGYYNFAISISSLPASILFGFLWEKYSFTVAFMTGASLSLLASIVFLFSSYFDK